ncbi:MAG: hypothetical protein U0R50_17065 [Gaiellales bacterium]
MQIENAQAPLDLTVVVKTVKLRTGSKVVARVLRAPGKDGRGLISLAGATVRAKLPAGVRAGQRLQLMVAAQSGSAVVLRMVREAAGEKRPLPARLAAALAERGDGELLHAAAHLSGGVIPLPGRRVVEIDDEPQASRGREGEASPGARIQLTLHTKELGAVTVFLSLGDRVIDAEIVVDGPVHARALAAIPELTRAIEGSTGLTVSARLQRRDGPPPIVPDCELGEAERFA